MTPLKENYRANLDVEESGAVVAAPDGDTPGGSYYYHWMRDAGLSIKAWMDINDNDYNAVKDVLSAYLGWCQCVLHDEWPKSYVGWVGKVQQKNDPNGIDVRIEPKFEIPSGEPYTGKITFLLEYKRNVDHYFPLKISTYLSYALVL